MERNKIRKKGWTEGRREGPRCCASVPSPEALNRPFLFYKLGTHFMMLNSDHANQSILKLGSARREQC